MSTPDKLHRNDKGKNHRKRQRPKGSRRAEEALDHATDQQASKRFANVALSNDTDLMKPSDAKNGVAAKATGVEQKIANDTDLMKPGEATSGVAKPAVNMPKVGNDTDLMKPDFASAPKQDARLESIVADLEVGPAKSAGVGKPPDPKQNQDVMQMFREVNGGTALTFPRHCRMLVAI